MQVAVQDKVEKQIAKIRKHAPQIEAAYNYAVAHDGALPAAEARIMAGESLDAVGAARAALGRAERQLASKRAANLTWSSDAEKGTADLKAKLAAAEKLCAATVASHVAKGFVTIPAATIAGANLEEMPLATTDTETAKLPTGMNLQRVIGHHCIAEHEAKGAAAAADAAAQAAAALVVFDRRMLRVSPELARKVIDTAAEYEVEMERRSKVAAEVDGLARMAAAKGKWPQRAPGKVEELTMAAAESLVVGASEAKGGAPDPESPAYALWSRHQATSGSIALYEQLCVLAFAMGFFATVVPGAVKALARYTFKVMEKYGGNFAGCRDLIRATIQVSSLSEAAAVVEALYRSESILVVREKDRFNQSAEAVLPSGGYRDFQALCLFQAGGVYRWGEVQVNLTSMVEIKGREGGGHAAYKFARSIGAFYEGSYQHEGGCDDDLCARVAAGVLLKVDLQNDEAMSKNPALLAMFCAALRSKTCRVNWLR